MEFDGTEYNKEQFINMDTFCLEDCEFLQQNGTDSHGEKKYYCAKYGRWLLHDFNHPKIHKCTACIRI